MSGTFADLNRPAAAEPRRKRRLQDVPTWVLVAVSIGASILVSQGAVAAVNYYTDQTTVTIDTMAWALTVAPGVTGYLPICGFGGEGLSSCPYRAQPGSDYFSSVLISGYFHGMNATLAASAPFHLVSTNPQLPALVPASGLLISFQLQLPKSAGEYSFVGPVAFS
jgi:hypothetical protein